LFKKPKTIKSIVKQVVYVPATMLVKDVLNILTKKRKSMAVVIDEYGGTAGIMTIEDIVEELVGEIEDEHDSVALIEEKLDTGNYKFSARLEVDYINETYKLNLPDGENYETLGGLIVDETEEIPQVNDQILIGGFKFTILEVSSTKIDLVTLQIIEQD
jgi:CBS domain containing-hemolysin-like protein